MAACLSNGCEYQLSHMGFRRRNREMKRGLVHNRVFQRGPLSKRWVEGQTRGFLMKRIVLRVRLVSFLRVQ